MASEKPISRKPSTDEWEMHRTMIIRLYVDENLPLSAIQNRLRDDYGFLTTHRTFKSKLKAWGIRKYTPSQEMGAILQDLIQTHRTDLTQRTGTKTVSVRGRSVDMAQVKRYIRRKGLPESYAKPWLNTYTSQTGSSTCSTSAVEFPMYAMKGWPCTSSPDERAWQPSFGRPNYGNLYSLHLPFRVDDPCLNQLMSENLDSTLQKRAWTSSPDSRLVQGEDRQPKRQRASRRTPTCSNLACPFYKNNPLYYNPQNPKPNTGRKYRACAGPGWPTIRRLREHLFRAHEDDLYRHPARAQLKLIVKGLPEAQHWLKIYLLLFPSIHHWQAPSPYYDCESDVTSRSQHVSEDSNGGLQSFVSYLHNVLPSRIREGLTNYMSSQNHVPSAGVIGYVVRNCLNQTGNEWLQGQDVRSADYQDLTCQAWDSGVGTNWPSYANTPCSSLDHTLSFTGGGLEYLTPGNQNEMVVPSWTWPVYRPNDRTGLPSAEMGMSLCSSADIMDWSAPLSTSHGLT